jgi:hypothetical protein
MRASNPSGLHLVPGFGARVIDANPQVWETALQRDGAGFGAFSGIEFGFNSPIDLKSESSGWKLVGTRSHADVQDCVVPAMATVSPGSPTRAVMQMPSISGVSPSVTSACPTGCWQMLTLPAKRSIGAVHIGTPQSSGRVSPRVARVGFGQLVSGFNYVYWMVIALLRPFLRRSQGAR